MRRPRSNPPAARRALAVAAAAGLLAACGSAAGDGATGLTVTATDAECSPSEASVAAGVSSITFRNKGSKENELYVLRADGSLIAERENVGPGVTVTLTVELPAGDYTLQCKPGMVGYGIQSPLAVTGAASASASTDPRLTAALAGYRSYGLGRLDAGLFFVAFMRDPATQYIPMQSRMARQDKLAEYFVHTASGLYVVPPGVREGGYLVQALLEP